MQYEAIAKYLFIGTLIMVIGYVYYVSKNKETINGTNAKDRSTQTHNKNTRELYAEKHPELYQLLIFLYTSLLEKEYALPKNSYEVSWDLKVEYLTEKYENAFYRLFAKDMKDYLGLKRILEVEAFKDSDGKPQTDLRGRASVRGWYLHRIEIWVHPNSNLYHNAATLAHEITHAFLHSYNIEESDSLKNERLTDIAAMFIGFDDIYRQGRAPIEVKDGPFSQGKKIYSITAGYLSDEELSDTLQFIAIKRKKYQRDYQIQQEINKKNEQIETLLKKRRKILLRIANDLLLLYEQNQRTLQEIDYTTFMQQIGDSYEHASFVNNCKESINKALYHELLDLREQISNTAYSGGLEARIHHNFSQMAWTISHWNAVLGKYL